MTARIKKLFSYLLKFVILILAFLFIYHYISIKHHDIIQFGNLVAQLPRNKVVFIMVLIFVLMVVNWTLESLKWWYLMRKLYPISVWLAIESVFCGLTWAVFTPNRLGEYGGRVMFLPNRKRVPGVFAMTVGAFGQIVTTNVLGAFAMGWFFIVYIKPPGLLLAAVIITASVFILLSSILYYNINWVITLLEKIKYLKKFHRFFEIMSRYDRKELSVIFGFCVARFLVFTLQYYLIIHLTVPEIPILEMTLLMFFFFFVQSLIPSLDLLDIGIRGITATTLFGYVTDQSVSIVVSVTLIFIINLILPAVLGSVFVLKLKFFDRSY